MTDKLTPQQSTFIDNFVEMGDATKAYKASGYAGDRSNAHKLVQRLSSEINQRLQSKMAMHTGVALRVLESLITDDTVAPRDRLNAISSWLDRAGVARASTTRLDIKQTDTTKGPRRVIRNGYEMVAIGDGCLFPPKDSGEDAPYDYSDEETARYLQKAAH